ncbi:MAG: hypothetical protein K0R14_511 [Burkholderiales bacterium]|jgi:hypothetical protein|nr:hypothetical protein [Burkholderiales bacterium]
MKKIKFALTAIVAAWVLMPTAFAKCPPSSEIKWDADTKRWISISGDMQSGIDNSLRNDTAVVINKTPLFMDGRCVYEVTYRDATVHLITLQMVMKDSAN